MPEYTELTLADGAVVRLALAAVGEPPTATGSTPDGLPDEVGSEVLVSSGRRAAAVATGALRTVLSPLGPLLQEVHDTVTAAPNPPDEINVEFGVQIGQDLKIGIVGANGAASFTVAATWRTGPRQG
ncbi:hypothetical protein OG800_07940 [Streptomyces sp. NBC_00445]|uniref:CU044_2847 family protein n=1 Tax=Streptomyces sp. NBC_00445 TaxID=2975745 RepID=UPI002E24EC74